MLFADQQSLLVKLPLLLWKEKGENFYLTLSLCIMISSFYVTEKSSKRSGQIFVGATFVEFEIKFFYFLGHKHLFDEERCILYYCRNSSVFTQTLLGPLRFENCYVEILRIVMNLFNLN